MPPRLPQIARCDMITLERKIPLSSAQHPSSSRSLVIQGGLEQQFGDAFTPE